MDTDTTTSGQLALIGVPSSAGARRGGQEDGPGALREAGLLSSLKALGFEVRDHGDLPRVEFRPDPAHPKAQNAERVYRVAQDVAARVAAASAAGALPVVLGGDCSIAIGVVAGLQALEGSLGLLYLDGDLDLNTPETTPSGVFDGMVTAHLLGRGHPELAYLGPVHPLLEESRLVYFGYNEIDGGIDPPEIVTLERSTALGYPLEAVRADPLGVAVEAVRALERRTDRILVHFDIDVTDTPAVDVPHPSGLPFQTALSIVELFLASPNCCGLVVTELNPHLDADGSCANELAIGLAEALGAARPPGGR